MSPNIRLQSGTNLSYPLTRRTQCGKWNTCTIPGRTSNIQCIRIFKVMIIAVYSRSHVASILRIHYALNAVGNIELFDSYMYVHTYFLKVRYCCSISSNRLNNVIVKLAFDNIYCYIFERSVS